LELNTELPAGHTTGTGIIRTPIRHAGIKSLTTAGFKYRHIEFNEIFGDITFPTPRTNRREGMQRAITLADETGRDTLNTQLRRIQQTTLTVSRSIGLGKHLITPGKTGS